MSKKTKLALALATVAPVEPVVLVGLEAFEAYLSPEQVDTMQEFAAVCLEHDIGREAFTTTTHALVQKIGAMPIETWKPVIAAIRADVSEYAAKVYRAAYKAIYGALPNKGTGTGKGTKGMSPKKAAAGLASRVQAVVDYVAGMGKLDINAATLAKVAKAAEALLSASESLKRAVNE